MIRCHVWPCRAPAIGTAVDASSCDDVVTLPCTLPVCGHHAPQVAREGWAVNLGHQRLAS